MSAVEEMVLEAHTIADSRNADVIDKMMNLLILKKRRPLQCDGISFSCPYCFAKYEYVHNKLKVHRAQRLMDSWGETLDDIAPNSYQRVRNAIIEGRAWSEHARGRMNILECVCYKEEAEWIFHGRPKFG